jgi:hypothetical protein
MNEQIVSCGIVLKRQQPRRLHISLLDRCLGRIEAYPSSVANCRNVCNGALVEYVIEQRPLGALLHDVKILDMVSYSSTLEMKFFHHLLELAYYGIPIGAGAADIFEHIVFVQENLVIISQDNSIQKKIIAKLLLLLGSESDAAVQPILQAVSECYKLNEFVHCAIEKEEERVLEVWIYHVVQGHPCARMFKTIQLLDDIRLL